MHPSERTKAPEAVRPEKWPVLVQLTPEADPPVRVEPLGLTWPELSSPEMLPPETTKRSVLLPQGVPFAMATHVPSKFPPPLVLLPREARRGSSVAGLSFREGFSLWTARGAWREPDSDFSSLPMLPPALPDCANARLAPDPIDSNSDRRPVLIDGKIAFCIGVAFKYLRKH